jgi:hypothetical protein
MTGSQPLIQLEYDNFKTPLNGKYSARIQCPIYGTESRTVMFKLTNEGGDAILRGIEVNVIN